MRAILGIRLVAVAFLLSGAIGCSTDPEQRIVGNWAADASTVGVALKAAKLKNDNPDVSAKDARDAARAMASFGLTLKADKTCQLISGENTLSGTYSFDKTENLVEMDFKSVGKGPASGEPFQPQQWVAMYNPDESKLELMMGGREVYNMIKEIRKTQPLPGLIVLRKQ